MPYDRQRILAQARSWLGRKEADGSFREIIDVYNSFRPLPRGYAVSYNDAWCATFISACAVAVGYTEIIPRECSCPNMISLFQSMGRWIENDGYIPKPGDIIFYDWQDTGAGDNRGEPDHVGIVEACDGRYITVIEGNISDSVGRRTISVNGRYIRGYGIPDYDAETTQTDNPPTAAPPAPKAVDVTARKEVISFGSMGKDVRLLQFILEDLGLYKVGIDGESGTGTVNAIKDFQRSNNLEVDGVAGKDTWTKLLN